MTFRGEIESLPRDVADLLAAERRAPRPSAIREATILARIESAVGVTAAVATGFVAGSSGSAAAAGTGQSLSLSSKVITGGRAAGTMTGTTAAGATTAAALSLPASKALIAVMALAVGGAGLGTTAYLATRANGPGTEASRRSATAMRAGGTAPAPSDEGPLPLPAGLVTTSGAVVVPVVPVPAPPALALTRPALVDNPAPAGATGRAGAATGIGGGDTDMGAESALLEDARRALARGRVETALDDVERHARSFPGGHLVEEREVLWVKALVLAGKRDAAQRRAADFRKHFPRSIQSDALTLALRTKK